MNAPVRWGILATGGIAARFVEDLELVPDAAAVAVASRTAEAAGRFAAEHGIARAYPTWQALAADDEVDIVYIAGPHVVHYPATKLLLDAGKPVLCEKPFTLNAAQAAELIGIARSNETFLMEAMWMRANPVVRRAVELITAGAIGTVGAIAADFSFTRPVEPAHRLRDPALGGGALLDLGVYPISLAQMILGTPGQVWAVARLTPEGVDETTGILLGYPTGAHAMLSASFGLSGPGTATISGEAGRIELPEGFYRAGYLTVHREGHQPQREDHSYPGNGLRFQAIEAGRCLRAGLAESPLFPLEDTLAVMRTMDRVRDAIGVRYPDEQAS